MFARLFKPPIVELTHFNGHIPDEIWILIFSNLEPCFLVNVLLTCRRFHRLGTSNALYTDKLQQYFPRQAAQINNTVMTDARQKYHHFIELYQRQFATIKNPAALRFLTFIIENDITQITRMGRRLIRLKNSRESKKILRDEDLDDMLKEQDADKNSLMTYLNKKNSQPLRDLVFSLHFEQSHPCGYAAWNRIEWLLNFIIRKEKLYSSFKVAAALNQIHVIEYHDNELAFNVTDALNIAVEHGHRALVEILARRVENIDSMIHHPVCIAARFNQAEIATFFIDTYPDKISDNIIAASINEAAKHGSAAAVEALAPHLTDFSLLSQWHCKPACIASENGHLEILASLLRHFPDLAHNSPNRHYNILYTAIEKGHENIVRFLCENHKELLYDENMWSTPLEEACLSGNAEIVRLLLDHGMELSEDAFYSAKDYNHTDVFQLLINCQLKRFGELDDYQVTLSGKRKPDKAETESEEPGPKLARLG